MVGLIGGNGAGKTTFINMVTGYLKPDRGTIRYDGRDITELVPREITRLGICRSFQIPQLFGTPHRAREPAGRARRRRPQRQARGSGGVAVTGDRVDAAADATLERFGLQEWRDRLAGVLPEGVRKLLDIAMAMVVKPKVLLLDEPTSGVSADEKFGIMDMVMAAVRAERVTMLFVEHDMDIVSRYAAPRAGVLRGPHHRRRRAGGRAQRRRGAPLRGRHHPRGGSRTRGGPCCALRT